MKMLQKNKGFTLIEVIIVTVIASIILMAISDYFVSSYRMFNKTLDVGNTLDDVRFVINSFETRLDHVDYVDLLKPNMLIFRKTYLPLDAANPSLAAMKSKWGCLWYGPDSGNASEDYKGFQYYETAEFDYGAVSDAVWVLKHKLSLHKGVTSKQVDGVVFSYDESNQTLQIVVNYDKAGRAFSQKRTLRVYNVKSALSADEQADLTTLEGELSWSN